MPSLTVGLLKMAMLALSVVLKLKSRLANVDSSKIKISVLTVKPLWVKIKVNVDSYVTQIYEHVVELKQEKIAVNADSLKTMTNAIYVGLKLKSRVVNVG